MKNIMTFDEFVKFFESDDSKRERDELSDFFSQERNSKRILTFAEWSKTNNRDFLFLTYDLQNGQGLHPTINNFLETTLLFDRQINNRRLTNNCFVAFPTPLNAQVMNNYGQRINNFFSNHLTDFRIYLNITSDFYLHP